MAVSAEIDKYGSVLPHCDSWATSPEQFGIQLMDSAEAWCAAGYKRIWLKLKHAQANLIPIAVAQGFDFHQVQDGNLLLIKRLVPDVFVPHQASHHIGAGGVVINDQNELLVISENTGGKIGKYKVPGGYVEQGEHIQTAVVREIWEETGIETAFQSIVLFRHLHRTLYGKSNIYFICRLRPLTHAITPDPSEVDDCLWMPVETFLTHENAQRFHQSLVQVALKADGVHFGRLPNYDYDTERTEFFLPIM